MVTAHAEPVDRVQEPHGGGVERDWSGVFGHGSFRLAYAN
jgi:hypothetical protein